MSYPEPRLIPESQYDSVCALCQNEIPKGAPLWWFNRKCYCMEHPKAEVSTEAADVSPSPSAAPSSTLIFDPEALKTLDRLVQAIDLQTEVLKGMRKDNNERR